MRQIFTMVWRNSRTRAAPQHRGSIVTIEYNCDVTSPWLWCLRCFRHRRQHTWMMFLFGLCDLPTPRCCLPLRTRTEFARRAFSVAAPHTWNSLPSDIRSCHTVHTFENSHNFKTTDLPTRGRIRRIKWSGNFWAQNGSRQGGYRAPVCTRAMQPVATFVANRHISISQIYCHCDVILIMTSFSLWRHSFHLY